MRTLLEIILQTMNMRDQMEEQRRVNSGPPPGQPDRRQSPASPAFQVEEISLEEWEHFFSQSNISGNLSL